MFEEQTTRSLAGYFAVARLFFIYNLVNRVDHLTSIVFALLLAVGLSFMWETIYEQNLTGQEIALNSMFAYAILGSIFSRTQRTGMVWEMEDKLRSGDIIIELLRPTHWQLLKMAEFISVSAAQVVVIGIPVFAISAVIMGAAPPASIAAGLVFLPSVLLGLAVAFGFSYLVLVFGFKYLQIGGIESALNGLRPILTCALIPLWILPGWAETTLLSLPFPYIIFAPLSIYVGRIAGTEIAVTFAIQLGWAVALFAVGAYLTRRVSRDPILQGG